MKTLLTVTVVLAPLLTTTPDAMANLVYWANAQQGTIYRANLDRSDQVAVITGLNHPWDIWIDDNAGKLYWTESIGDRVARANLDGSGVETLLSINDPESLAVDSGNGKLYFDAFVAGPNIINIHGANLDGSSLGVIASVSNAVTGIAVDPTAQKVYWLHHFENRIERRNANGSGATDVVLDNLTFRPTALTLDSESEYLYWADENGSLFRSDLEGAGQVLLYSDVGYSRDLYVDAAGGQLFWTTEHGGGGTVSSAPLDGTGPIDITPVDFRPLGIAVSAIPEPSSVLSLTVLGIGIFGRRVLRGGRYTSVR